MRPTMNGIYRSLASAILCSSLVAVASEEGNKLMIIRMGSAKYTQAAQIIKSQLPKSEFEELIIEPSTSYEEFRSKVDSVNPKLFILMDNLPVKYGVRYNKEKPAGQAKKPGVALMALNLKATLKENSDIAGVAFEAPPYSLLTQFRYISAKPVKNVLTFYRKSISQSEIDAARKLLKGEGMSIDAIDVEQNGNSPEKIEAFIRDHAKKYLMQSDKYDAHWLLLDSVILSPKLFASVWQPLAQESTIPFVTGLDHLASSNLNFAIFAINPDINDLAGQASQMIETILGGSKPSDVGVEDYLSVKKVLNPKKASDIGWTLKKENLAGVDQSSGE